jgi:hypothetical protein
MVMKERLLWSLLLVCSVVWFVNKYRPITEDDRKFEWNRLWIFKTHSTKKYDCVVTGDSRVYRGISASAIEQKLPGLTVFNFGYSSGSFSPFMLDKIESKLDHNAKRPIIVIGVTPYSLTPKASADQHIREQLGKKREEIWEYLYFEPLKKIFEPFSVQAMYESRKRRKDSVAAPYYHQESYYREGWVASWKIPADPKAALPGYVKDFTDNTVSQQAIDTLINRVRLWRRAGIEVYGFRPPTTIDMVKLEKDLSGFDEIAFVEKFQNAGGSWIDLSVTDYESYDGSHLTKRSAIEVSEKIGEYIRNNPLSNASSR